jgi:hypothetical protein
MLLGSGHYLVNSYRWVRGTAPVLGTLVKVYWAANTIIVAPFALMLGCLLLSHSVFLLTNQATIDIMKGGPFYIPIFEWRENVLPSRYDMGFIANLTQALGGYSSFWYPHYARPMATLQHFPVAPKVQQCDLNLRDKRSPELELQMQSLISNARAKCRGSRIKVADQLITV